VTNSRIVMCIIFHTVVHSPACMMFIFTSPRVVALPFTAKLSGLVDAPLPTHLFAQAPESTPVQLRSCTIPLPSFSVTPMS
jgi:hypothetical protein